MAELKKTVSVTRGVDISLKSEGGREKALATLREKNKEGTSAVIFVFIVLTSFGRLVCLSLLRCIRDLASS